MKKNNLLLISSILGTIYLLYIFIGISSVFLSLNTGAEFLGGTIGLFIVAPHIAMVFIGLIFNWLAYFNNKKGFALTSGILYSIGLFLFLINALWLAPMVILSFIGYAKMNSY